jgi:Hint domain
MSKNSMGSTFGFAAGTAIHTPNGVVAIERLKQGDRVYSKSRESSTVQAVKLLGIQHSLDQEIQCLQVMPSREYFAAAKENRRQNESAQFLVIIASGHLIRLPQMSELLMECRGTPQAECLPESGWARADEVYSQAGHCVELIDGSEGIVHSRSIVHRTTTTGVGWVISEFTQDLGLDNGNRIDLRDGKVPQLSAEEDYNNDVEWWDEGTGIRTTVHHLLVEGDGGYFVGENGIYVGSNN